MASLFIGLDICGVTTQVRTALETEHVAKEVEAAEDTILNDDQLLENLTKANKLVADEEAKAKAKELNLPADEEKTLVDVGQVRAENEAQKELENLAAAKGEEAARKSASNDSLIIPFAILRTICCAIALVCVGLLARHMINKGVTIGSLTLGPSSVNVNRPSLPFQSQIDDIIYLFRRTGRTVFVFEDLDRMDQRAEILTSLRELNYKLNTYERTLRGSWVGRHLARHGTRPTVYKFVYCIQAGCIPDAEERSKFFDFIVPVVPHGDASSFGELLDKHLDKKKGLKPDSDLLSQAGHAILGMRMFENLVNEYIVHRTVLGGATSSSVPDSEEAAGMDSKVEVSSMELTKNNLIFAIVAYKNICPVNYARFERHKGFLHEMLSIGTKRDFLGKIDQARPSLERDVRLPYAALYRKYGRLASWDSALFDSMLGIASRNGYKSDWGFATNDFVQYALEHGYIREDVRSYATLRHKSMGETDRAFCDSVNAWHWGEGAESQDGVTHYFDDVDPKEVLRSLECCAFAANVRALNKNVLNHLIDRTDLDRELRQDEEDPLLELLYTMGEGKGVEFFCRYLATASVEQVERFYTAVTSPRYQAHGLLPSFGAVYATLEQNASVRQLAVVAFLRLARHAADHGNDLRGVVDRLQLQACLDNDAEIIGRVWQDGWNACSEYRPEEEVVWYKHFNPIADEVAEGLQALQCEVKSFEVKTSDGHEYVRLELLGAYARHEAYAINADNI